MKSSKITQIILITFFGMLSSILFGLVFYNTKIFIPHLVTFQFVTNGFMGALFFGLLQYTTTKEQIFGIILILLLDIVIILGKSISVTLVVRDVFYLVGLLLSIKFYYQFIKSNTNIKYYLRSFALAFFYSILTILFGSLVYLINANFEFPPFNFLVLIGKLSILIGFGIGIGIDVYLQNENKIFKFLKVKTT